VSAATLRAVDDDWVLQGILWATWEAEHRADDQKMLEQYKEIIEIAQELQNQPGANAELYADVQQTFRRMIEMLEGK
jgi:hypothetical protein